VSKRCRHSGCQLAGVKFCECFGRRVVRRPSYVVWAVWATPTHPSCSWAVGQEIRPGCLKVVAYAESKLLADALAKSWDLFGRLKGEHQSETGLMGVCMRVPRLADAQRRTIGDTGMIRIFCELQALRPKVGA
jgi:hypothetical protein